MVWKEWAVLAALILIVGIVGGMAGGYVVQARSAEAGVITCD